MTIKIGDLELTKHFPYIKTNYRWYSDYTYQVGNIQVVVQCNNKDEVIKIAIHDNLYSIETKDDLDHINKATNALWRNIEKKVFSIMGMTTPAVNEDGTYGYLERVKYQYPDSDKKGIPGNSKKIILEFDETSNSKDEKSKSTQKTPHKYPNNIALTGDEASYLYKFIGDTILDMIWPNKIILSQLFITKFDYWYCYHNVINGMRNHLFHIGNHEVRIKTPENSPIVTSIILPSREIILNTQEDIDAFKRRGLQDFNNAAIATWRDIELLIHIHSPLNGEDLSTKEDGTYGLLDSFKFRYSEKRTTYPASITGITIRLKGIAIPFEGNATLANKIYEILNNSPITTLSLDSSLTLTSQI